MKPNYKIQLTVTLLLLIANMLLAQTPQEEFKSKMDYIFNLVDKSKITTGLLADYALELAEIAPYNGIVSDTNEVNTAKWLMIYSSIYDAKINNLIQMETPESVAGKFQNASAGNNAVPVAIMHYQYNKLDDDALNKGWLTYSNEQIREVAGKPSPYLTRQLFAVAPQTVVFNTNNITFMFKQELFFRNNALNVSKLEVNFNNEDGYKSVSWNTPATYQFASNGFKTVYFRITYSDGTSYISHTSIYVESVNALKAATASYTDDIIPIPATTKHSGGQIEIHYAKNNTAKKLRKPLIFAEPFDMSSILSIMPDYTLESILSRQELASIVPMIDNILEYDIVYVNAQKGMDDIFRNAELFKVAIDTVNSLKDKTYNHQNVVIGISMGGLIARYALRSMELEGKNHDTWKYISIDSPHKGAYLPLGLQGLIRNIETFAVTIFGFKAWNPGNTVKILNELYGVLDSKAARQMLIYYCNKDMKVDNSEHLAFQREYDRVSFPTQCQNVAFSCGNAKGITLFAPNSLLFKFEDSKHFNFLYSYLLEFGMLFGASFNVSIGETSSLMLSLANILPGNSAVKANFSVYGIQDKKAGMVYDGHLYFKKWVLWVIPVTVDIAHKKLSSTSDMLPLDGAAGSYNEFKNINNGDGNLKKILENFKKDKFTFIPTPSSLALSNWEEYVNKDIRGHDFYAEGLTGFDSYVLPPDTSTKHCDVAYAINDLAKHLASPPFAFTTPSSSFNVSAKIPLKNPQNLPVSWSINNSKIGLTNKTNTSVDVYCNKANETGMLTAAGTYQLSAPVSAALFNSPTPVTIPVTARKRLTAKDNVLHIDGNFGARDSLATLNVREWVAGTPVAWQISDNSNFRIVSASEGSVVIEALAYNKPLTVTATLTFIGQTIQAQTTVTSPKLAISIPGVISCEETTIHFTPLLTSGFEFIEWSTSYPLYVQFVGEKDKPSAVVKGLKSIEGIPVFGATVKVKGETVMATCPRVWVAIPERVSLSVLSLTKPDPNVPNIPYERYRNKAILRADVSPFYSPNVSYRWNISQGELFCTIGSDHAIKMDEILSSESAVNFDQLANTEVLSEKDLDMTSIRQLILEEEPAIISSDLKNEDELEDTTPLVVRRVSSTINSNGSAESVVLGVSVREPQGTTSAQVQEPIQETLINVQNMATYSYDPPIPYEPEEEYKGPQYVFAKFKGDVTITCTISTPRSAPLTASVFISGDNFRCTYESGSRNISIRNTGVDNDENPDNNTQNQRTYTVNVYNDYGLMIQLPMDSSTEQLLIPMAGYATGYYYVNIINATGEVVTRTTLQVR